VISRASRDVMAAASAIGLKVQILKAGTDREIDAAFVSLVQARTGALLVGNDALFNSRIEQIVALAASHAIPTMYSFSEFAVAGGLISYGTSLIETYRQVGLYVGRILKGEKPADLPVQQATKLELIINLKTAKALGLPILDKILARACHRIAGPRSAGSAINVVRRRMLAAALTAGEARGAAAGLFRPQRAHPRIAAALPYQPEWCSSPDVRAQTLWRLRSDSRQTHP